MCLLVSRGNLPARNLVKFPKRRSLSSPYELFTLNPAGYSGVWWGFLCRWDLFKFSDVSREHFPQAKLKQAEPGTRLVDLLNFKQISEWQGTCHQPPWFYMQSPHALCLFTPICYSKTVCKDFFSCRKQRISLLLSLKHSNLRHLENRWNLLLWRWRGLWIFFDMKWLSRSLAAVWVVSRDP